MSDQDTSVTDEQSSETEETQSEVQEESQGETQETQESEENINKDSDSEESESQPDEKLTAKGTKLDPDPKSAVHQELANERRIREQYQQVLNDPVLFERYAQQMGYSKAQAAAAREEVKNELEFTPDSFNTAEDIAKALNSVTSKFGSYKQEIEQLKGYLGSTEQIREQETLVSNLTQEISSAKELYPELNQNSQEYDPDLTTDIVEEFKAIAIDPQTQRLIKGKSLAKIAERFVKIARRAKGVGNKQAQTRVVEKTTGKIVTNNKKISNQVSETDMSPEQAIANRIKKVFG